MIKLSITKLVFLLLPLCASMCCPEEDLDYTRYTKEVQNITVVEERSDPYMVGDTLLITTVIPFRQEFNGEILMLDDLSIDQLEGAFFYNLSLFKQSAFGEPTLINISQENIVPLIGNSNSQNGVIQNITTKNNDSFDHSVGVILKEAGTYYLGGPVNYNGGYYPINYYLQSASVVVDLYSNLSTTDPSGNFQFEVLP